MEKGQCHVYGSLLVAVALIPVLPCLPNPSPIKGQVTVLDPSTARVNWSVSDPELARSSLEIVYSPRDTSYYTVQPVTNPTSETSLLEHLLPFTEYQLIIRTDNSNKTAVLAQTATIYFSTAVTGLKSPPFFHSKVPVKSEEVLLVLFVLFLWGIVLGLFFQRWGKIRGLLPYQPVYSKELSDRLGLEVPSLLPHLDSDRRRDWEGSPKQQCGGGRERPGFYSLVKTSSTMLLKQKGSFEEDYTLLRKTQSAENIRCPQIVINEIRGSPCSSVSCKLPVPSSSLLKIPGPVARRWSVDSPVSQTSS